MADYSISLGALISPEGLQRVKSQIETIEKNPIKLQIDSSLVDTRIKGIKQELKTLGGKSGLKFDTSTLEASLDRVSADIREIKTAFGTLDSKAGMGNLLTSINQISTALDNASKQFVELNTQLNSLAGKDFSVNIGINMGSSAAARNGAYGSLARGQIIPQLQQQVDSIVQHYNVAYKTVASEQQALLNLVSGTKLGTPTFFNDIFDRKAGLFTRMGDSSNFSRQIQAYREYISLFERAASLKNPQLASSISGASQSADQLATKAEKARSGVDQLDNSLERLKGIFGSGVDAERLSAQLDSIVADLNEIKVAMQSLSSTGSLDGLTLNFKELSTSLKELTSNFTLVRTNLTSGLSGAGSGVTSVSQNIKEADIKVDDMKDSVESLRTALQGLGFNSASIDTITKDFQELGISVKNVTTQLKSDGSVVLSIKGIDQYERAVTLMRSIGKDGSASNLGSSISQSFKETEVAFGRLKTIADQMKNLKVEIAGLDASENSVKISELTSQLNRLQSEYKELYGITSQNLSHTQLDTLKQKSIDTANAVQKVKAHMKDVSAEKQQRQALKETEVAFGRLKTIADQMKNLKVEIAGLDPQKDGANISELTSQLNRLQAEYKELYGITGQNLSTTQMDALKQKSIDTANAVQKVKAHMKDVSAEKQQRQALKETEVAFGRLKTIADQMKNLKVEIAGLDPQKDGANISELTSQLNRLQAEYKELYGITKSNLSSSQLDTLKQKSIETANAVQKVKSAMADAASAKVSNIQGNFGNYEAQLLSLEGRIGRLATKTPQLEAGLNGVRQALATLKSADGTDALIAANERYKNSLKQVQAEVTKLEIAERNSNSLAAFDQQKMQLASQMSGWLRDNSAAAKQFGGEIRNLQVQLSKLKNDPGGLRQIKDQFKTITMQAKEAGVAGLSLGDRFKKQLSQYSTYLSGYMLFSYVLQGLRSMFEQVKSIDSAMTELKKVTDETADSYNKFLSNAATRSKEIGTTIDGLVSSTADFARLGYGFEDAQGLAEVANIYAVVGDEVEGVEGATESLISTMAAFKDEMSGMSNADFAMSIIDRFNEIGNNFAISSGGIGEALERSASSLMAANNTIDESIALITAANTVVQNPEAVGTAFKTISMRIRGAKTELEDAGLETEGMVESTAKLREEIMALSGVDIMENDNTFKSTYQIMDELAAKWKDLTDIQQAKCLPDNVEIH